MSPKLHGAKITYSSPQTTTHAPNIRHTRTQRIIPPLRPQA